MFCLPMTNYVVCCLGTFVWKILIKPGTHDETKCLQLGVADKSFMVCTSEKHVSRDFWSFVKLFHRIGHGSIS